LPSHLFFSTLLNKLFLLFLCTFTFQAHSILRCNWTLVHWDGV
jgi:hypothetical protein